MAWRDDDTMWLSLDGDPLEQRPEQVPWVIDINGGAPSRARLAEDDCFLGDYLYAQRIDDTSAAFVLSCQPADRVAQGDFSTVEKRLVAINGDGAASVLAELPAATTAFAWNEELQRGIVSAGSRICQGLGWIEDASWRPMDNVVPGTAWTLGDDLRREKTGCDDVVRADTPSWSSDGRWIALMASPNSVGRRDRLNAEWTLYVLDATGTELVPLVENIKNGAAVAISPNGERIAFSGIHNGMTGLFVVERSSRALVLLSSTLAYAAAFSPDGGTVAALHDLPDPRVRATDLRLWRLPGDPARS